VPLKLSAAQCIALVNASCGSVDFPLVGSKRWSYALCGSMQGSRKCNGRRCCPPGSASGYAPPRVMLLCGADMVESFLAPGVWRPEHLRAILGDDHGVVCIAR